MKVRAFKRLLSQIEKLTINQVKKLQNQLNEQSFLKVIKSISVEVEHCSHCGGTSLYKWGVRSKLQRYKCKECNKTFNALSNTSLARLRHKEKWNDYAKSLLESSSIEKSAKRCDVAISTSFRWRHRMLKVSQEIKAKKLHGIVELDDGVPLEGRHIFQGQRKETILLLGSPINEVLGQVEVYLLKSMYLY